MPTAIPIRDLKDTTRICELVRENPEPIIVTRNGYEEMVLVRPDEFKAYERALEMERIHAAIAEAEKDVAAGRVMDAEEFMSSWRERHGISR